MLGFPLWIYTELSEKTFTPRIQVRSTAHMLEKKLGLWVSSDPIEGSGLPEKGKGVPRPCLKSSHSAGTS